MDKVEQLIDDLMKAKRPAKIQRDAFLYMDPKGKDQANHAQCKTCMMWTGPKGNTCTIHGKRKVTGDMSCGIYVNGPNHTDMIGKEMDAVDPKESGLVKDDTRCENCAHFDGKNVCELYYHLNNISANLFDLDEKVKKKGCCNAFIQQKG